MSQASLYWYDYETFGTHPALDRPAQFAGIRTDENLEVIGDELMLYCQPSDDCLPDPVACSVTGIGPMQALEKGLPEYQFIAAIREQLSRPGTCNVGYNNIRFDDEFTRFTLFRNFHDAYRHEYADSNSRWDLLDVVRMTRALRPDGIEWPMHEDGTPSNRLEDLTKANGIKHTDAHDALADVHATIAIARLIRKAQPRLYEYAYNNRLKDRLSQLLNWQRRDALVHVSGMIPGEYLHTAVVVPLCPHPQHRNEVIVWDLRQDPRILLDLDSDEIRERLFTPSDQLPKDKPRLGLKTIRINRAPVVAPLNVLNEAAAERCKIDLSATLAHHRLLPDKQNAANLETRLRTVFRQDHSSAPSSPPDVDASLYAGGFFSPADTRLRLRIASADADQLTRLAQNGLAEAEDSRLVEMLFRYRARNFFDSLSEDDKQHWKAHCQAAIQQQQARLQDFRQMQEGYSRDQAPLGADMAAWLARLEQRIGLQLT